MLCIIQKKRKKRRKEMLDGKRLVNVTTVGELKTIHSNTAIEF